MSSDPVDQLGTAFDATGQILTAVRDEQWSAPTPCSEWTVRDLVGHMVTSNHAFVRILNGAPPQAAAGTPPEAAVGSGADGGLVEAYRDSAAALLRAFRQPGVLDRVHTVPIGPVPGIAALHLRITEVLVHGWDLARATGQHADFPEDLAEQELAFSRSKLADIPAGRTPFAPPQPVPEDAPAIDRLVALLGRNVSE
ncbi:MAG TPA: TIGR03086 family metal-binding protein [Streptosporangiaceae bacterium]